MFKDFIKIMKGLFLIKMKKIDLLSLNIVIISIIMLFLYFIKKIRRNLYINKYI